MPGRPVIRVLTHSASAGGSVRACAVAEPSWPMGAAGPSLMDVWMVLVPLQGSIDHGPAVPVGSACRVCALRDCVARQTPSLLAAPA